MRPSADAGRPSYLADGGMDSIGSRCSAWYSETCSEPNAPNKFHTGSLEHCMDQCALFASFNPGSCSYGLFSMMGEDEDCRLFPDGAMTMADFRATCDTKGQPILKPSQWSGKQYNGITSSCPEADVDKDPGPCVQGGEMKYQLAECDTPTPAHTIEGELANGEECVNACNTYHQQQGSNDPNPYMTWHPHGAGADQTGTCNCFTAGGETPLFSMSCRKVLFKGPLEAGTQFEDGTAYDAEQDARNLAACIAASGGTGPTSPSPPIHAIGGGPASPPPSPPTAPPAHLPPYPPAAPVLSPGEVKQTVSATFTMDAQCTDDLTSKIRTETAKACQVAVENTNVTCTPSTRRRRLDDAVSVTVTMGTTADSVRDVQAAAETFFGTNSADSDTSPASTAFQTTVSGASVSAGAVSSGDPHLGFAHGGEADFRGRHGVYYNFFSAPGFGVNVKTEESRFFLHGNKLTVDGTFITEAPHSPPSPPSARPVSPCGSRLGARGRAQPHAGSNQVGQRLLHRGEPKRLQHGLGVRPGQLRRRKLHARARQPQEDLRPADRQDHLFGCVVHRRELDADRPRQLRLRPYLRAPAPP